MDGAVPQHSCPVAEARVSLVEERLNDLREEVGDLKEAVGKIGGDVGKILTKLAFLDGKEEAKKAMREMSTAKEDQHIARMGVWAVVFSAIGATFATAIGDGGGWIIRHLQVFR